MFQKARSPAFSTQKRTLALATILKLKLRFEAKKKLWNPKPETGQAATARVLRQRFKVKTFTVAVPC